MLGSTNVGVTIAVCCLLKGTTQSDLAGMAKVSPKTLSKWKKGDSQPDQKLLEKVTYALNPNLTIAQIQAAAAYLDNLRTLLTAKPWQRADEVTELSDLSFLTIEQLRSELGRVHELRLAIEAEMKRRRGLSASDTSLQTPLPL